MAYERAPILNMNPAIRGTRPPYALDPINPIETMVPPPPPPQTVDPETEQKAHVARGGMILTALKQLGAMGQQASPVNLSDLMPDIGGAKGAGFIGSRNYQGAIERNLRARQTAAQIKAQEQRDLMQKQQQEEARAEQVNYQKMKFKNDMELKKMEQQQKQAEQEYERNKPENRVKALEAELKIESIMSGIPNLSEDQKLKIKKDFTALVQGGTSINDAMALYGEYGLIPKDLNIATKASQRAGKGGGSGGALGDIPQWKIDRVSAAQDPYAAGAAIGWNKQQVDQALLLKKQGGGGQEDDIGVTQYKAVTDAIEAIDAAIKENTPYEGYTRWDTKPDTPEMKATREALQKKKDILDRRKNQFLYGTEDPTGTGVAQPTPPAAAPVAQATGDPEVDAAIAQGGKLIQGAGGNYILMPDGKKFKVQ